MARPTPPARTDSRRPRSTPVPRAGAVGRATEPPPAGPRPAGMVRTRRLVVIAVLLALCAISLAPHVRLYVEQERHEAAVRADIVAREAAVADLQRQQELWSDDAYVVAQARERLHYAFPGETTYVVPPAVTSDPQPPPAGVEAEVPAEQPWYRQLWEGLP